MGAPVDRANATRQFPAVVPRQGHEGGAGNTSYLRLDLFASHILVLTLCTRWSVCTFAALMQAAAKRKESWEFISRVLGSMLTGRRTLMGNQYQISLQHPGRRQKKQSPIFQITSITHTMKAPHMPYVSLPCPRHLLVTAFRTSPSSFRRNSQGA